MRPGSPWVDTLERYGTWNSAHVRFQRRTEQGVCDVRLQTLIYLFLTADWHK